MSNGFHKETIGIDSRPVNNKIKIPEQENQNPKNIEEPVSIVSQSYDEDLVMKAWCEEYPNDSKCLCINPPEYVYNLSNNSFNPYYCWYKNCLNGSAFVTSLISSEQTICNSVICEVFLDQINLNNDDVLVENHCVSNYDVNADSTIFTFNYLSEIPNMFVRNSAYIIFVFLILLFLIL